MNKPGTLVGQLSLLISLGLVGCGESGATLPASEGSESESTSATLTYDKGVRERACEAMPIELVARIFEIPAAEIERYGGTYGCSYRRATEDLSFYAKLYSISVYDDVEKAKRRYADFTRNATQEDVDAQKEEIDREVEKQEALETEAEKKTAGTITGLMAASTPDGGLRHEPVEGLADEAKIDNDAGILRVRSGNMMFYISAYNGPREPKYNFGTSNIEEIMAAQRDWSAKILPDRVRAAVELAREVVPRVEKLAN